jgi:hypothetical protein
VGTCFFVIVCGILFFMTFRHPLKMALFNVVWPLIVINLLLAVLFFDSVTALIGQVSLFSAL